MAIKRSRRRKATQEPVLRAIRAEGAIDDAVAADCRRRFAALLAESQKWLVFEADGAQSARAMATGRMGRRGGCGGVHWRRRDDEMVECEGERGASGRARGGRPLLG